MYCFPMLQPYKGHAQAATSVLGARTTLAVVIILCNPAFDLQVGDTSSSGVYHTLGKPQCIRCHLCYNLTACCQITWVDR
jgi:hypothetical protein